MFENKLFRFREYNQYSLSELNNKTLWFSSAKSFNDPFEFQYELDLALPGTEEGIRNWLLSTSHTESERAFLLRLFTASVQQYKRKKH